MKSASGTLITLLNANTAFLMADCYTISMLDGTILRWSSADFNISLSGNAFLAQGSSGAPIISRNGTRVVAGLEVDTLEVTIQCGDSVLYNGTPMVLAAQNGAFDGARLKLERAFMASWGDTSAGSVVLFEGAVAGMDPSSTQIVLQVKSDLEKLNVQMPRTTFQPMCPKVFGGGDCGVSIPGVTVTGTATGSPTTTSIPSARAEASGYFNLGVLQMTSGAANGSRRAIAGFASGTFTLAVPLPSAPAAGDTFSAYPGCDRTYSGGCTKYSNTASFGGFPLIPRPETTR